ncbi:MAG: primosomal protein N' [Clostridiaceae bacterium]|nr:primosomal protein N' [Clostridiaceae bacterium]
MNVKVASVAVNVQSIAADKRYDYLVPNTLGSDIVPGVRVLVPFGRGNRHLEAMVLSITETKEDRQLKYIITALDEKPVLDRDMLKLAIHMRNRVFCPLYTIVHAMLPAGYWFSVETTFRPAPDVTLEEAVDSMILIDGSKPVIEKIFAASGPVTLKMLQKALKDAPVVATVSTMIQKRLLTSDETVRTRTTERTAKLYSLAPGAEELPLRSPQQKEVVRFLRQTDQAAYKEINYYTGVSENVVRTLARNGVVECETVEVSALNRNVDYDPVPIELTEEQSAVAKGLCDIFNQCRYATALLRGVTGSGKTLVYMELITKVLSDDEGVILLVPEIALTPQLTDRFYRQFGSTVAVLHSALSVGDRYDTWQRIRSGKCRVVIGTRSAVFAPVKNLGVIIIDEEHEHTYKSDAAPRYHAREVAQYRCFRRDTLLVLGSATPSVTSAYYAETGVYESFVLRRRYGEAMLPEAIISDIREAYRQGYTGTLGPELLSHLQQTLSRGEQAILFLNRRGSARQLLCMECGQSIKCKNCSVAMSYHAANGRLICHQCGYSIKRPDICPSCSHAALVERGSGTQAVERELLERFPKLRVLRMDSDTTGGSRSHGDILNAFGDQEADVLIGTQMVAKGLDFENVTLVGVIDADTSLYSGDYAAAEETFSLITQVIGRAGRGLKYGYAVIQTAAPKSDVILAAAKQDYERFYREEIALRQALRQPPFFVMIQFFLSGPLDENVYMAAVRLRDIASRALSVCKIKGDLLGPAAAPIQRLNNRYRYTLTVRCKEHENMRVFIGETLREFNSDPKCRGVSIYADML